MKTVLLLNKGIIQHYRVAVYNYLFEYLGRHNSRLCVVSEGIEEASPHTVRFPFLQTRLTFMSLSRLFVERRPSTVIFWLDPAVYTLATIVFAKLMKIKVIHWGHRRPLQPHRFVKYVVYNLEHLMDDAIVLYSEEFRKYVIKRCQRKTFVANNTLHLSMYRSTEQGKNRVKGKYGIVTQRNIICMGRMQRRKRIGDLVQAFRMLDLPGTGLILVGPDPDGIVTDIEDRNIYKLGPVYGIDSIDLLSASDVYCLPGAIGLGIVDALYCGLPVVTENVTHGPEITYLRDGINGFVVPKGDITQLAAKFRILLTDDSCRKAFSQAAIREIMTRGHIDRLCEGFRDALKYVCR